MHRKVEADDGHFPQSLLASRSKGRGDGAASRSHPRCVFRGRGRIGMRQDPAQCNDRMLLGGPQSNLPWTSHFLLPGSDRQASTDHQRPLPELRSPSLPDASANPVRPFQDLELLASATTPASPSISQSHRRRNPSPDVTRALQHRLPVLVVSLLACFIPSTARRWIVSSPGAAPGSKPCDLRAPGLPCDQERGVVTSSQFASTTRATGRKSEYRSCDAQRGGDGSDTSRGQDEATRSHRVN